MSAHISLWLSGNSATVALDNLKQRGSELALRRLAVGGVEFRHGDIRNPEDLADSGSLDLLVECSAEPSVQAGVYGGERYLINTNLMGTINRLDHARHHDAAVIFLSRSRIYPVTSLRELPLVLGLSSQRLVQGRAFGLRHYRGVSPHREPFALRDNQVLCSELIIAEYVALYGLRAVVNRCGVVDWPLRTGRIDQGFAGRVAHGTHGKMRRTYWPTRGDNVSGWRPLQWTSHSISRTTRPWLRLPGGVLASRCARYLITS